MAPGGSLSVDITQEDTMLWNSRSEGRITTWMCFGKKICNKVRRCCGHILILRGHWNTAHLKPTSCALLGSDYKDPVECNANFYIWFLSIAPIPRLHPAGETFASCVYCISLLLANLKRFATASKNELNLISRRWTSKESMRWARSRDSHFDIRRPYLCIALPLQSRNPSLPNS